MIFIQQTTRIRMLMDTLDSVEVYPNSGAMYPVGNGQPDLTMRKLFLFVLVDTRFDENGNSLKVEIDGLTGPKEYQFANCGMESEFGRIKLIDTQSSFSRFSLIFESVCSVQRFDSEFKYESEYKYESTAVLVTVVKHDGVRDINFPRSVCQIPRDRIFGILFRPYPDSDIVFDSTDFFSHDDHGRYLCPGQYKIPFITSNLRME